MTTDTSDSRIENKLLQHCLGKRFYNKYKNTVRILTRVNSYIVFLMRYSTCDVIGLTFLA